MKEISEMLIPQLRKLATETQKSESLWTILDNCMGDKITIHNIATNPVARLNPELVAELFKRGDIRTRKMIAHYANDKDIIETASRSSDRKLRSAAALNQNCKKSTLVRLTKDHWWGVRLNALLNLKARNGEDIRKTLISTARNEGIRVPNYSRLPLDELQERASETQSTEELWMIIKSCKGDSHTIQMIIENPHSFYDVKLISKAYEEGDDRVRITLARDSTIDEILDIAICSENRAIRSAAALNPNVKERRLSKLFYDPWWGVRVSVLSNVNTTKEMILKMAQDDPDVNVRNLAYEVIRKM